MQTKLKNLLLKTRIYHLTYKSLIIFFQFILLAFFTSACSTKFFEFKTSANNKIIDQNGFQGKKRKPLYNNKYISLAKKNLREDNLQEEEEEELSELDPLYQAPNIPKINQQIYIDMMKKEEKRRRKVENVTNSSKPKNNYPSIIEANDKINKAKQENINKDEIYEEISRLRAIIDEIKKEMPTNRCLSKEEIDNISKQEDTKILKQKVIEMPNNKENIIKEEEKEEEEEETITPHAKIHHKEEKFQEIKNNSENNINDNEEKY